MVVKFDLGHSPAVRPDTLKLEVIDSEMVVPLLDICDPHRAPDLHGIVAASIGA